MLRTAVANKKYFVTVFVVSCLLLAVFTSILYRQYRITQSYANWVSHSYEVLRHAQRMFIYILDVETGQRGYILSGSEKFLQPYNSSIEKLDGELESLISITADNPAQQSNLILLRDKINKLKKALSGQMLKYGARGGKGIRVEDLRLSQRLMNDVRTAYHNFVSEESITLQSRLLTADKEQRRYLLTLFIGSLLAVMGLIMANLLIFYLMARNRQTIENLRESEKRFAMVMNGINDGIFEYDLNNNKFYFSPNCKAMLGYADHELPNTREGLNELLHPEDYHATQETFQLYIDRKIPTYKNIFRMRHKDGTWRWILSRGVV
jgi:PAS domain S-box-containing protein